MNVKPIRRVQRRLKCRPPSHWEAQQVFFKDEEHADIARAALNAKAKIEQLGYDTKKCLDLLPTLLLVASFCNVNGSRTFTVPSEILNQMKQACRS